MQKHGSDAQVCLQIQPAAASSLTRLSSLLLQPLQLLLQRLRISFAKGGIHRGTEAEKEEQDQGPGRGAHSAASSQQCSLHQLKLCCCGCTAVTGPGPWSSSVAEAEAEMKLLIHVEPGSPVCVSSETSSCKLPDHHCQAPKCIKRKKNGGSWSLCLQIPAGPAWKKGCARAALPHAPHGERTRAGLNHTWEEL